jgi:magnesium-transporting ATPase (P-type)
MKGKSISNVISAFILLVFAFVTLFMSSSVIFDWFGIRAKEGNYVLFIVWTNFILGFLYVAAAYYFFKNNKRTFSVLLVALIVLIIALLALQFYIHNDGIYELKTVKAMIFRIVVTLAFALIAFFTINKSK